MEIETRREGNGEEARPLQTIFKEASDRKERGQHPLSPVSVLSPRSVLSLSRFCPLSPVSILSPRSVLSLPVLSSLSRLCHLSPVSDLSPRSVLSLLFLSSPPVLSSLSRFYPLSPISVLSLPFFACQLICTSCPIPTVNHIIVRRTILFMSS